MTQALQYGGVDLAPSDVTSAALGYTVEASADGTNWGNPQAVITAVQSRLQDGSLAAVESFQNREAPIHIRCVSPTYQGLVNGEAALVAETRRESYNTLSWTPSVELAVASVYDVIYGVLDFNFDDLGEVNLERYFTLTLSCLPFPRSATEVIAVAVPAATPTITSIDTCAATTGWTGSPTSPPTLFGSTLAEAVTTPGAITLSMTRTGTVSLTGTPFVFVDYQEAHDPTRNMLGPPKLFYDDGAGHSATLDSVQSAASPTSGYTRIYYQIPATVTSVTTLRFQLAFGSASNNPAVASLTIDQVSKATALPTIGTRRQLLRSVAIQGTVRTQGRLSVQHETSSLGETLVYCYQDGTGYVPSLRSSYFAGGTLTADAATVSGSTNMLDVLQDYRISAATVPPGNYHLYARLKGDSAGPVTITITASTLVGSTFITGTQTISATVTLATTYQILDLGSLSLPTARLPANTVALVRITLVDADTSGIDITLDEAWIFNLDIGTLNHIDCGSVAPAVGGSSKRLWFDPATVTNDGQDAVFRGHTADRTDAFHPSTDIKGYTPPVFDPAAMSVFTVTTNALDAAVELRHYPRFMHNVGIVT